MTGALVKTGASLTGPMETETVVIVLEPAVMAARSLATQSWAAKMMATAETAALAMKVRTGKKGRTTARVTTRAMAMVTGLRGSSISRHWKRLKA